MASAAYRHFPGGLDELLVAIGDVSRREMAERITLSMRQAEASRDPAANARRRFRASGQAHVDYVLEEPGLFQVATRHDRGRSSDAGPYALLSSSIDDLVRVGVLDERRRQHAVPGPRSRR